MISHSSIQFVSTMIFKLPWFTCYEYDITNIDMMHYDVITIFTTCYFVTLRSVRNKRDNVTIMSNNPIVTS